MCMFPFVSVRPAPEHAKIRGMNNRNRNLLLLIAIGCITLIAANITGLRILAAVAKVTASTGFLLIAWHSGALTSLYGRLILVGLVFSFAV